jgi:NAD(P)-dependent dehydrogenase (short-subunit alcohol dehydrogenase family)
MAFASTPLRQASRTRRNLRYQFSETEMAEQSRLVPLGAMAQPGDIADIIVFLASDRSRFITGEVVHANGGLYMA